ncbi:MAG: hypothetical protein ACXVEF_12755 [Polyangiales bacterium]
MPWDRIRRLVKGLLAFEMKRPRALLVPAFFVMACSGALTPRAKLDDTVQETNTAIRFGRSDIAMENVAPASRKAFMDRHKNWGGEVRIVDVEFAGTEKVSADEAVILVSFGWYRPTEGVLRATTVKQTWRNDKGTGPWKLFEEERVSGDIGLLGEQITVLKPEKKNAQFETTVIR